MESLRKALLVATMLSAPLSAAADTVFSNEVDFNAATDILGSDDFADLAPQALDASTDRNLSGGFAYTASSPDLTWVIDTDQDFTDSVVSPALSTNFSADTLTIDNFSADINSIAGSFFTTDIDGAIVSGGLEIILDLSIGDSLNFSLTDLIGPTFWGYSVETGFITALTIASLDGTVYPTIGMLAFGNTSVAPVDPGTGGTDPGTGGTDPGTGGTDPGTGTDPDPVNAPAPAVLGLLLLGLAGTIRLRRTAVAVA
ncbi:MAG: hypothetical protein ACO3P1_00915 [Pseudomonadales bacterium]